jgi:integrase
MAVRRRQYGTGSVFQRADGRWIGRAEDGFNTNGTRSRITVTAKTETEAKRLLRDRIRARDDGAGRMNAKATVKVWAEKWLAIKLPTVRPKTWAGYQSAVRQHIVPTIGHKRLDTLTPADIRAVSTAVRKAGRSSSTARHAHVTLVDMLTAAQAEGYMVPPRALLVDAPSPGVNDRDAIPLPDALALLQVAAGDTGGSRFVAALLQGMRQGECLGLTWDLVDLGAASLDVSWQLQAIPYKHGCSETLIVGGAIKETGGKPSCGHRFGGDCPQRGRRIPDGYELRPLDGALCLTRPKTAKGQRIIPLVPWMAAALEQWQKIAPASPHNLVWPRINGRPALAKDDTADWNALQARAGVEHPTGRAYHLHEARHTTATLLAEAGVDPSTIMAILGHSSIATQAAYKHVRLDHVRDALEGVAKRLQLG